MVALTQETWSGFSPTTVPHNNSQSVLSPTTVPEMSAGKKVYNKPANIIIHIICRFIKSEFLGGWPIVYTTLYQARPVYCTEGAENLVERKSIENLGYHT